jgi:hypothetical protein
MAAPIAASATRGPLAPQILCAGRACAPLPPAAAGGVENDGGRA